ncbi:Transcription factor ibh1-like [Thalictrum thalictroides]|uniref:Transcription factor ibh1-like n=1 Tax=Thalictrum thalictroides TaxID=46969 RepID=A0A7J6W0M2_THATH|nr:Transcription factor ibh1-like [Thalictrum thalictroides]
MRPPSSFKQEFFKKWVVGLQYYGTSSRDMNILERKKAIKLSADVAMASARDGKTYWSRYLIAKASKEDDCISKNLVKNILGNEYERLTKPSSSSSSIHQCSSSKWIRSKNIVRRSCNMRRIRKHAQKHVLASSIIAKRMVKKRTQVLKALVPGGESMDEFCLLEETIDYLLSLQAQVDVMHKLVNASGLPS